jgi:hypothetical protein
MADAYYGLLLEEQRRNVPDPVMAKQESIRKLEKEDCHINIGDIVFASELLENNISNGNNAFKNTLSQDGEQEFISENTSQMATDAQKTQDEISRVIGLVYRLVDDYGFARNVDTAENFFFTLCDRWTGEKNFRHLRDVQNINHKSYIEFTPTGCLKRKKYNDCRIAKDIILVPSVTRYGTIKSTQNSMMIGKYTVHKDFLKCEVENGDMVAYEPYPSQSLVLYAKTVRKCFIFIVIKRSHPWIQRYSQDDLLGQRIDFAGWCGCKSAIVSNVSESHFTIRVTQDKDNDRVINCLKEVMIDCVENTYCEIE